ncbi:MAG: class I SAM-dependent methyltransferase [Actinomycetota bacterium]
MKDQPLETEAGSADLDELIRRLRARVEERRRSGLYPPGLEDDLDAHFRNIAANRPAQGPEALRRALALLGSHMAFDSKAIPVDSRLPGGEAVHRATAKLVGRQTAGILDQVRSFATALHSVLQILVNATEEGGGHFHSDLVGRIEALGEELGSLRHTSPGSILRRLEKLEAAEARRQFRPWFAQERFMEEFRGSGEEIAGHYGELAKRFADCSPVLDIGCGRGEFLELLGGLEIEASGVEIDPELVTCARERGLKVEEGDGLRLLGHAGNDSLGGLVLIQVVEHFSAQELVDLVALAAEKLRPGGKVLIETINPQSLYVYAHSFAIDPTHVHPVHPAYLAFLFREAGFSGWEIEWRAVPPKEDALESLPEEADPDGRLNANLERLNRLLFAPQDFALIATR